MNEPCSQFFDFDDLQSRDAQDKKGKKIQRVTTEEHVGRWESHALIDSSESLNKDTQTNAIPKIRLKRVGIVDTPLQQNQTQFDQTSADSSLQLQHDPESPLQRESESKQTFQNSASSSQPDAEARASSPVPSFEDIFSSVSYVPKFGFVTKEELGIQLKKCLRFTDEWSKYVLEGLLKLELTAEARPQMILYAEDKLERMKVIEKCTTCLQAAVKKFSRE